MTTQTTQTPIDSELLTVMRDIYSRYTGYQVAEVIRVIRQELEQQREELALDEEISQLLLKRVKKTS